MELFEAGLKRCKLEHADIWRLMALERGGMHSEAESEAMVEALQIAKRKGLCRFTGFSTHDRKWDKKTGKLIKDDGVRMMEKDSPATEGAGTKSK